MAVTTETNRTDELTTDGVETDFDFSMLIHAKSEVQVKHKPDAGGDYTALILDTDYGVVFTENGGTVSTNGYRVPLADGKLLIIRHLALTQLTNWLYNDNHTEQTHQDDFDRSVMRDIQIQGQLDRCPQFPIHSDTIDITFPEPAANEIIAWNAGGTDLTNMSISAIAALVSGAIIAGEVPENLDDLADVDAVQVNGNFIVGDGANWVSESGATARTSLGLGTGDSPQFTRLGIGSVAGDLQTALFRETFTIRTGGRYGVFSDMNSMPSGILTGDTVLRAGLLQSHWKTDIDGAGGDTFDAYMYGSESTVHTDNACTGDLLSAIGAWGRIRHRGSGDITTAIGVLSSIYNDDATTELGGITSAYNFLARGITDKATGAIATRYGLYIEDITGGGNLTTQYGIYCPALAAAAGDNLFIKNISADSDFGSGDITTTGAIMIGTLTLRGGLIEDSSGDIEFGNENLTTLGLISANAIISTNTIIAAHAITGGSFITGGNIGPTGDSDLLQLAASALTVNGTITSTGNVGVTGTITASSFLKTDTSLLIKDALSANYLTVQVLGAALTAARTLSLSMGDNSRILTFSGNPTLADWFDQSVKTTASPAFAGLIVNTTDLVVDTDNHRVGIGTAAPSTKLDIESDGAVGISRITTFANISRWDLRRAQGTQAVPLTVANGQILGDIEFWGYTGSVYRVGARIRATTDAGISGDEIPTRLQFYTTADGATSPTERMRMTNAGNVGINDTAPAEKLDVDGNINVTGVLKIDDVQVIEAQGAAVADATDADDVILRLNDLLARVRAHGLIAT